MSALGEIGVYLPFIIGIVFLLWGLRNIWRTAKILTSGGISTGRVKTTRIDREGEAFTTISFLANEDVEVEFEQGAPSFAAPLIFPRSQISYYTGRDYKVFYDTAKPRRATASPWFDIIYGLVLAGFGVVFIAFAQT